MGNVVFESLVWLSTVCTGMGMDVRGCIHGLREICIHAPHSWWCNPNECLHLYPGTFDRDEG